jgi:hypothetical protein
MIFIKYYYCNQNKEDKMGVACSKHYKENAHRVLARKPEGKDSLSKPMHRLENNITM